eukprot:TRINITY_DN21322_c0_g5_i1.p1 TRINITY_DN21322_c0_g5~~TRINITY_DN21322_c0_g5_i1.p1  ORF type:complete len:1201 (-),score=294.20 TRINITY_DN21322_c0_g5_i1:89-3691(-)
MGAIVARREEERAQFDQSRSRAAGILEECRPDYVEDLELLGLAPRDSDVEEFEAPSSEDDGSSAADDDDGGKLDSARGLKAKVKEDMRRDNLALIRAAAAGRLFTVMQLLARQHVIVDYEDKYGRTALHLAAERGNADTLDKLVNAKASVHHTNQDGWTPLHAATFAGQVKCMQLLLTWGASVNQEERHGCSPLFFAVSSPKLFLVDLVSRADRIKRRKVRAQTYKKQMDLDIKKGQKGKDEKKPRFQRSATEEMSSTSTLQDPYKMWENYPNRIELMCMEKLLAKFGVIVDALDKKNRTPVMYAARYGRDVAMSRLLAARASPTRVDREGRSALFYAAMSGHNATAKMLIEIGGQVNKQDAYFQTPLHCAMTNGDEALSRLLLRAEAAVNAYDCEGRTPIMLAMDSMNRRLFAELVQRGSNLDVLDRRGWNVVVYSINTGMFPEVLSVLQRTGDRAKTILSYQDPQGKSALHHAVMLQNVEMCNRTITQLVSMHHEAAAMPDCNGNTPTHYAAELGRLEALRILTDGLPNAELRNNRDDTPLLFAAHGGHIDCVLALLHDTGEGAMSDASAVDIDGRTLLMRACISGHLDLVNLLIQNREGKHTELAIPAFDVNVAANDGSTAVILAAQNGHWQLLPSLVLGGANISAKDADGFGALHFAACEDEGLCVKSLIDLGFHIDAADNNGWTALMHAADRGCNEAARVLVDCKADLDARNADGDTALQTCLKRKDHDAIHTRNILMDAIYDRNEEATLGVPAQGSFIVSILDANELYLEGSAGDINPYVCLQFCPRRDAIPQTSYTSCAIHDPSPEWHEVFRFDTESIDTSAYLVAWVLAAPGIDETEIVESTALGISAEELRKIRRKVDTSFLQKVDYTKALDATLKRVRRRAELAEDLEVEKLRQLAIAKEEGIEPTEDAKAPAMGTREGESLEERRWQELKNLRDLLAEGGCRVPKPIAPRAHMPLGCVVVRFRHLRQAVWSTVPVVMNRMVRLSRRGNLRLEVDFRPRYFGPKDSQPEMTVEEEEAMYGVGHSDEMDTEVEIALMALDRPYDELLPIAEDYDLENLMSAGALQMSDPMMLYKRFMQIAVHSKRAMELQAKLDWENTRKARAKAARLRAQEQHERWAKVREQLAKVREWLKHRKAIREEAKLRMERPFEEIVDTQAIRPGVKENADVIAAAAGLTDEPWLEELLDGSRFV